MPRNVLTLRQVSPSDEDFLFEVYASTRAEELAQLPWDDDQRESFLRMQFNAQQQDYQRRFPDADHRLILLDDQPIGRHYVARSESEIRILEIAILPAHRLKGIGTRLVTGLLDEAVQTRQIVRIYVERFNPALSLFERLGFAPVDDIGSHFLLEWRGLN
jgi:GNAT superfamily N-acetyltransferase